MKSKTQTLPNSKTTRFHPISWGKTLFQPLPKPLPLTLCQQRKWLHLEFPDFCVHDACNLLSIWQFLVFLSEHLCPGATCGSGWVPIEDEQEGKVPAVRTGEGAGIPHLRIPKGSSRELRSERPVLERSEGTKVFTQNSGNFTIVLD